jgi:hypothetical protein
MNNIWKGLVVGAVTGAAIGLSVDLLKRAGDGVAAAGQLAREHGPELTAAVTAAAKAGAERVREADLPAKARDAAERVRDADLPAKVRDAARIAADSDTADTLRQAAKTAATAVASTSKQVAEGVSDKIDDAMEKAKK